MADNKNLFIAIALSVLIMLGWQYFVAGPQTEAKRQEQALQAEKAATEKPAAQPAAIPAPGGTAPTGAVPAATVAAASRDDAIAQTRRVAIDTPRVTGSINLKGARLDDLRLDDYRETTDPTSQTIVLLSPSSGPEGYFAEFGWIGPAGGPAVPGPETQWTAPAGATLTTAAPVELTYDNGAGLVFRRKIAVDGQYMFTVTDTVENRGGDAVALAPYGRIARLGEPKTAGYYILHEGPIGVFGSEGLKQPGYKDIREEKEQAMAPATRGWLGITDKYWATALVPDQAKSFTGRFSHFATGAGIYQADFRAEALTVAPGATVETASRLFAGAKQVVVINGYRDAGVERFDLMIDWGWFYFITKPIFFLLDWFYHLVGNFGISILIVTVLVKALFFPLANKSYKSMSAMKKLQPAMQALKERYPDDRAKQQQELMELYKREKINPVAGCWPMLLQIPVFFALYKVLFITIEMRHAPFFGWIQDLSARDPTTLFNLFGLIPWTPPDMLFIGIWPLIMGVTMWLQMRMNPTPPDPAQAMIFNWMPVIFTFMMAGFPAGLVIYWSWNNLLSVAQQALIMHRQGVKVELFGNIAQTLKRKPKATDKKPAAKG